MRMIKKKIFYFYFLILFSSVLEKATSEQLWNSAKSIWSGCGIDMITSHVNCQVSDIGYAVYRYGTGLSYIYKYGYSNQECSTTAFGGDPAPGETKTCSYTDLLSSKQLCSKKGQTCFVSKPSRDLVGYGKIEIGRSNLINIYKPVSGSILCDDSSFPGLPYSTTFNTYCHTVRHDRYYLCALEGNQCSFGGTTIVKYSVYSSVAIAEFTNGVFCGDNIFGSVGSSLRKKCQILRGGYFWQFCATEGYTCNIGDSKGNNSLNGKILVKYGYETSWAYKEILNNFPCKDSTFGYDPAPSVPIKQCYYAVLDFMYV